MECNKKQEYFSTLTIKWKCWHSSSNKKQEYATAHLIILPREIPQKTASHIIKTLIVSLLPKYAKYKHRNGLMDNIDEICKINKIGEMNEN